MHSKSSADLGFGTKSTAGGAAGADAAVKGAVAAMPQAETVALLRETAAVVSELTVLLLAEPPAGSAAAVAAGVMGPLTGLDSLAQLMQVGRVEGWEDWRSWFRKGCGAIRIWRQLLLIEMHFLASRFREYETHFVVHRKVAVQEQSMTQTTNLSRLNHGVFHITIR